MGLWRRLEKQFEAGEAPPYFGRDILENKQAWYAQGLDDEDLAWVAGGLVEAGFETTAATLNSLVLHLAGSPRVQARAHEELMRVVGPGRLPALADMASLPYVRACVKEMLRMNPILSPGIRHFADEDVVYKGHVIPRGTVLLANTAFLHYDPRRFERPFEFMPERYLGHRLHSAEYAAMSDPYARDHFTFSTGRRVCPGARPAENGLDIALAYILWAFEVRPPIANGVEAEMDLSDNAYPDAGFTIPKPFAARFIPRGEERLRFIKEQPLGVQRASNTIGSLDSSDPSTLDVLIVGAGPVGLALALDLGRRGVRSTIVECGPATGGELLAKASVINERTMEFCRLQGIRDEAAHAGFPADLPGDTIFCTGFGRDGKLIGRLPTSADRELPEQSCEILQRCPQFLFDPVLARAVARQGMTDVWYGVELVGCEKNSEKEQNGERNKSSAAVTCFLRHVADGRAETLRARYLVACDGPSSTVRKALSIPFEGKDIGYTLSVIVRVDLARYHAFPAGERYLFIGPEGTWPNFTTLDGRSLWRFTVVGSGEKMADPSAFDMRAVLRRVFGRGRDEDDVDYELMRVLQWRRSQFTAARYYSSGRRVFLAGDAASPLIVPDGSAPPPDEPDVYIQTARPGHRAPHCWLKDGRSTLGLFGRGFVLLRFGPNMKAACRRRMVEAARKVRLPLECVDIEESEVAKLYERRLVLVRPDGMVAWRGDAVPDDVEEMIDRVRGAYITV
ncbi:hypothetical protein VTK56DRAFT_4030 [Thermocarpiscus australiensis]